MNIVLMAGSGKRFSDAGYKQSKPLLPVSGKTMIEQAVKTMPRSDEWVFVVRQEHMKEKILMETLQQIGKKVEVLADPEPIGQLNSCLVAEEYYTEDAPFFVGACDLSMQYDAELYEKIMSSENPNQPDMLVFSFTKQPNLTRNPQAWGWLKQDEQNKIHGVSVKIPISQTPYNDHAITGSFAFKNGRVFMALAKELMRRGVTVRGEYYIDSMIDVACELGYNVCSFPVSKYIGWGVPVDYEEYLFWESVFKQDEEGKNIIKKREYVFWKEYFSGEFG